VSLCGAVLLPLPFILLTLWMTRRRPRGAPAGREGRRDAEPVTLATTDSVTTGSQRASISAAGGGALET
jgi:hypothetical protein